MQNYEWKSDFSPLIHAFLEQYRLAGFKFERQELILQHFDHFCSMQGSVIVKIVVSKILIFYWLHIHLGCRTLLRAESSCQ